MSQRMQYAKRNIIWGLLSKLTSIVFPFINRTAIIYLMGITYVGLNGLFTSILQVFSIAELGISSAIIYHMYKPITLGDDTTLKSLLNFYKKVYRGIGLVMLVAGVVFLPFLRYVIGGDIPAGLNIYILYLLYLLNTVTSYFAFAYKRSLLSAYQRKDIVDKISIFIRVFVSLIQLVILWLTHNFYFYLIALILGTILDNLISHYYSKKLFPNLFAEGNVSIELKNDIIEKTKGMLVYKIVGITRNSLDSLFISSFLNLTTVGIYSNYFYVMNSVKMLLDALTQSMSASVGHSVADSSVEKNYRDLMTFTLLYSWIAGICANLMFLLYQDFMILWVGKAGLLSFEVTIAMCLYFYVWSLGDIRSQYTDATGLWFKERLRSIVEATSNIILNYLLIKQFGVLGVVLATALSIFVIGNPWSTKILFDNYFKNGQEWHYVLKQGYYLTMTVVIGVITYFVTNSFTVSSFIDFAIKAFLSVIVVNALYGIFFYITGDFKEIQSFTKKMLRKN